MIKLSIRSGYDHGYVISNEYLSYLDKKFNNDFKLEDEINLFIGIKDNDKKVYEVILHYSKNQKIVIESEGDLIKIITENIEKYQKQKKCNHSFIRQKDQKGQEYPDGRAICSSCGFLEDKGFLESIPNINVAKMSTSDDYICLFYWGNDVFLQGGECGIVFNTKLKSSYLTSFFEAFPNVGEYGTFIRGEGENIIEAEKKAWEKYQRHLSCEKHEWTRFVHSKEEERTDGYAKCIHCGLHSTALKPLTLCTVCSKPTTTMHDNSYYCFKHYFEIDSVLIVNSKIKERIDYGFEEESERFKSTLKLEYKKKFFHLLGEEKYERHNRSVSQVCSFFIQKLFVVVFGNHPFRKATNVPELDDKILLDCKNYFESNFENILPYILEKEKSVKNSYLIDKKYFKNRD